MRMARLTPNHNVYVFEGRLNLHDIIKQNIQRNNINNIQLINDIRLSIEIKKSVDEPETR